MTDIVMSIRQTERGRLLNARAAERTVSLLATTALTEHGTIGEPVTALAEGFATVGEIVQARALDLTSTGRIKLAVDSITRHVAPAFNALRKATPVALADLAARSDPFSKPYFTEAQPPAVRVELRQHARALPLPAVIKAVQSDASLAAAIVEGGLAMSGLPADIFARVERDMAVGNATRVLAGQRLYRTSPSAADPIGGQPDPDAARTAGEALITALEAEMALLSEVPALLASGVDIVAILTDSTRDEAFALLTA